MEFIAKWCAKIVSYLFADQQVISVIRIVLWIDLPAAFHAKCGVKHCVPLSRHNFFLIKIKNTNKSFLFFHENDYFITNWFASDCIIHLLYTTLFKYSLILSTTLSTQVYTKVNDWRWVQLLWNDHSITPLRLFYFCLSKSKI